MKIAYLGPKGTFTYTAAIKFFGSQEELELLVHDKIELIPYTSIKKVFGAVESLYTEMGVVAIENFHEGKVKDTFKFLPRCSLTQIIGETFLQVVHCLGALPNHAAITHVISKDNALDQCADFLDNHYPNVKLERRDSTAAAAEEIRERQLADFAAIAPREAILGAGLQLLAEDLLPNNRTRFAVLGREYTEPTGDDKTYLQIHPGIVGDTHARDRPGILADIANMFVAYKVNMEDFKSHPDGKGGNYFYVEINGHQKDPSVSRALQGIKTALDPMNEHPDTIKVFGSYANSHWKE